MNNALPVFVYGTLRHGLGNYLNILHGNTVHEEPATLHGARMHDAGGCPFVAIDPDGGNVTGEIMYLNPATIDTTMRRLDRLEGYRGPGNPANMYDRTTVEVTTTDGSTILAHTYLTGEYTMGWLTDMPLVTTGDWKRRRESTAPRPTTEPCCGPNCEGTNCWDCRGTGHSHAGPCTPTTATPKRSPHDQRVRDMLANLDVAYNTARRNTLTHQETR